MKIKYLDEFVQLTVASEMLRNKLFPNAKEITESFGAYHAARNHLYLPLDDPGVAVLCVGDGHRPRTAATFALRSAWTCFSVDPAMVKPSANIARLNAYRSKIEDWKYDGPKFTTVVVVAVHSHASLSRSVQAARLLSDQVDVVSIPCCFRDDLRATNGWPADTIYKDKHIIATHNKVFVWKDFK